MRSCRTFRIFHSMENFSGFFPRYGKLFSTPWKTFRSEQPASPQRTQSFTEVNYLFFSVPSVVKHVFGFPLNPDP